MSKKAGLENRKVVVVVVVVVVFAFPLPYHCLTAIQYVCAKGTCCLILCILLCPCTSLAIQCKSKTLTQMP